MTMRLLAVAALLFLVACGSGVNILPEPFTRERADGKIPVHPGLIHKQERAILDGMPEKEAEVARWQRIEKDYNQCRLSAAEAGKAKAEEVFAACMSQRGYVYMYPIDAEHFHNDIAHELRAAKDAAEKKAEERRIAAEKKAEEERIAAERAAEERRIAAEKKAEEERIAAEKARIAAEKKAERERKEAELVDYVIEGNETEVKRLLLEGVSPNATDNAPAFSRNPPLPQGYTALMLAAFIGHAEVVKLLLSAGANPNAADDEGNTAMMRAAGKGHAEVVKLLLSAGVNPNVATDGDWTALMSAASGGSAEVVKLLLSAGANPNAADNFGHTPLMSAALKVSMPLISAALNEYAEVVKLLLSAGANPNAVTKDDWTALVYAVSSPHFDIAEMLLSAGANPNHVYSSFWGYNVMDNAIRDNNPDMVRLLRRYGGVCRATC